MQSMKLNEYHLQNSNVVCHSLCTTTLLSNDYTSLLGLGTKFYLQAKYLAKRKLKDTIDRFRHDARVKYYRINNIRISNTEPPALYFKLINKNIQILQ